MESPPTQRLVKSDYGIFDEKQIPVLIPDSTQRICLCYIFAFTVILILAYVILQWLAKREQTKLMPSSFSNPLIKGLKNSRSLDIMTAGGVFGRWIYVYGLVPDEKVQLIDVKINQSIIPWKAYIETPKKGELGLCKLDLGRDFLIYSIHIKSETALSRVMIRDISGSKVFEYL